MALAVDGDAVLDAKPRAPCQIIVRQDADAHDRHLGFDRLAVLELRTRQLPVPAGERLQSGGFVKDDAMAPVERAEIIRCQRRRHALQDALGNFDNRDLQTLGGGDSSGLQANVPPADDEQLAARCEAGRKRIGIRQIADGQHACKVTADFRRQAPRPRSRRQHELVVAERRSIGQRDQPIAGIELDRRHGEPHVDVLLVIPSRRPDQQPVDAEFAGHIFLRERRALIGQHRLFADHDQWAAIAERPQLGCQRSRRLAAANDDDGIGHRCDFVYALPGR